MKVLAQFGNALRRWFRHDGPGQAAAVSFYAIFAMAPLLVFGVVISSKALGPEEAKASAVNWLADMLPRESAETLVSVIHLRLLAEDSWWLNVFSALALVWAVSLVFVRLLRGTRDLFDQPPQTLHEILRRNLFRRLFALGFALVVGFAICALFIGSSLAAPLIREWHLGAKGALSGMNALVLAGGGVLLLAFVPSTRPKWRALATSGGFLLVAFLVGRAVFQGYITRSPIPSAYGVAGALVVFLLWIYYLACGYFIGAALCAELNESETGGESQTREGNVKGSRSLLE